MPGSKTVPSVIDSTIPAEFLTPEARMLVERVKHKSELTDKELLMLAMVAAQAALARYYHPGHRSADETLNLIGHILDHEDVVAALFRQIKMEDPPDAPPSIAGP